MGIDIGGIGKEYMVDRVLEMALESGIENILVDFGQDLRVHGEPPEGGPWRIGLEDPFEPGQCWAGVSVQNCAVATSGDYSRNFTLNGHRYGHIIDPRNGYPVANHCLAVSVIAPLCTTAGILSMAAFILGPDLGLKLIENQEQTEGCIVTETGRWETTKFNTYRLPQ
jgi:thiamine biosynthesis lipoprotein